MNENIRNILVIRFRRVGDSVLSMALCHGLRQTFPDAKIHLVINEGIHELYENHPDVDSCIVFSKEENEKARKYIKKVWQTVHDNHYDIIIDMRTTLRTLLFSAFSRKTPWRIGEKKWYSWIGLNHRIDNHADSNMSRIEQNNLLLNPLKAITEIKTSKEFKLYVNDNQKAKYHDIMGQAGIDFSKPVILATPTARLEYKVLPAETMKDILKRIIDTYDAQIIFNFAGKEREIALRYHNELNNDPHIFTNIVAPSLPDLCALISNCNFFFGNEGGPRHISQALDIPSFAIFPPGIRKSIWLPDEGERFAGISPDDYMSLDEQISIKLSYAERMGIMTADRIWQKLNPFLKKHIK